MLEQHLNALIEAQQRAEEEQVSGESLRAIQRAFREALLALPPEEYDWFDIHTRARREGGRERSPDGRQGLHECRVPLIVNDVQAGSCRTGPPCTRRRPRR
jgi:hypothetical protein